MTLYKDNYIAVIELVTLQNSGALITKEEKLENINEWKWINENMHEWFIPKIIFSMVRTHWLNVA